MSTLEYYNENAKEYCTNTVNADVSDLYKKFLPLVKEKGRILDLGCGSGRDSKYFINQGFDVTAIDGSSEMCALATEYIKKEVKNITFNELDYHDEFDGVWACASLLHVEKQEMSNVLDKIYQSLKKGGVLYLSYKYGDKQREKDGRIFSDYNEIDISILFDDRWSIIEYWLSDDVRKDRDDKWLNILVKKK